MGKQSKHLSNPKWLEFHREIQALAQTGLTYTTNDYDIQRYKRLLEIAAEICACHTDIPANTFSRKLPHPGRVCNT